jgi:hypothetical protein
MEDFVLEDDVVESTRQDFVQADPEFSTGILSSARTKSSAPPGLCPGGGLCPGTRQSRSGAERCGSTSPPVCIRTAWTKSRRVLSTMSSALRVQMSASLPERPLLCEADGVVCVHPSAPPGRSHLRPSVR